MMKKVNLLEENEQLVDRYITFIQNKIPDKKLKRNNDFSGRNFGHSIYIKDSDYENVKGTLYDIKKALTDADFELTSVEYDDFLSLSTYNYEKEEFGFVVKVKVTFDEADFDGAECRVTVTVEDINSNDNLTEEFDPNWIENANDSDLVLLRSEFESIAMNSEKLYNAVKNSIDRGNEKEVNNLISFLKRVNSDLEDTIEAWRENNESVKESMLKEYDIYDDRNYHDYIEDFLNYSKSKLPKDVEVLVLSNKYDDLKFEPYQLVLFKNGEVIGKFAFEGTFDEIIDKMKNKLN